jgi:hypothetical protein
MIDSWNSIPANQKVKPSTIIIMPLPIPSKKEDFKAFSLFSLERLSSFSEYFEMNKALLPNDLTVLIFTTVSLINEPINFYTYSDLVARPFRTAIFIAPDIIIKGLRPKTIKVNCQELVKAKISEIDTVERFMHITAHTPDIMLFSW